MSAEPWFDAWASWCLTYLVHGTVLLALAWSFGRVAGARRLALQETAWKVALLAPIASATLQSGSSWEPAQGAWVVWAATATDEAPSWSAPSITAALALTWAAAIAIRLARLIVGTRALATLLRLRSPVAAPTRRATLAALLRHARRPRRVAYSASGAIEVPLAFGLVRPEICVPARVADLAVATERAILAHELGHLHRRDPLWTWISRAIESILFFQPLNFVATRRLAELAEYLADDAAVAWTGDRRALAHCLTEVASWTLPERLGTASALGGSGRTLSRRVERLLDPTDDATTLRWAGPPLAVAVSAVACLVLPRVAATDAAASVVASLAETTEAGGPAVPEPREPLLALADAVEARPPAAAPRPTRSARARGRRPAVTEPEDDAIGCRLVHAPSLDRDLWLCTSDAWFRLASTYAVETGIVVEQIEISEVVVELQPPRRPSPEFRPIGTWIERDRCRDDAPTAL